MEEDRPRGGVTYGRRLGQDLLHALVRHEWLALLDADRLEESEPNLVERRGRLFLHDLVE